jgi:hypothetical protein
MAQRRSSLAFGLVLVLLGVWFLVVQFIPGLQDWFRLEMTWPLIIVGVAVLMLVFGILAGIPVLVMPASIVGGIGGLLYWQNATGNWESWAYAWTLIPGFVGVGTILMGLWGQETRRSITGGVWLIAISLVLFAVFGSFLGGPNLFGPYWPVLLIAFGVLLLIQSFFRSR